MKILVAAEAQEPLIVTRHPGLARLRQIARAENQARRSAVLEATVTAVDRETEKDVTIERRRRAEKRDLCLAKLA